MDKIELLAKSNKGELKLSQELEDKLTILCGILPKEHRKSKFKSIGEVIAFINTAYILVKNLSELNERLKIMEKLNEFVDFLLNYLSNIS